MTPEGFERSPRGGGVPQASPEVLTVTLGSAPAPGDLAPRELGHRGFDRWARADQPDRSVSQRARRNDKALESGSPIGDQLRDIRHHNLEPLRCPKRRIADQ